MIKEYVVRDENNSRIKKMVKVDITETIKTECKSCLDAVLFKQCQQIAAAFQCIDSKHTYGILSEIKNIILGLDEYQSMDEQNQNVYSVSYNINLSNLVSLLVNLSTQMLFPLTYIDDNCLDQKFIHKTILMIWWTSVKYINSDNNSILPAQKEQLNGLIKKLIDLYNNKLDNAIVNYNQNCNLWTSMIIQKNMTFCGLPYLAFQQILTISNNQAEFVNFLRANKIDLLFEEKLICDTTDFFELS